MINTRFIWNFELQLASPLTLPAFNNQTDDTTRWEFRYFWEANTVITLQGLDNSFLDISRYKAKHKKDEYYILPHENLNLKIRKNQLIYKPLLKKESHCVGYGKKINLNETPSLPSLPAILRQDPAALIPFVKKNGTKHVVEKETVTYSFTPFSKNKLELSRLLINNTVFFSACIESPSERGVCYLAEKIFNHLKTCDYISFLTNRTQK